MSDPKVFSFPASLTEMGLSPQEKLADSGSKKAELWVGVPRERTLQENRVALSPAGVSVLTGRGYRVLVETDAGTKAQYSDHDYAEAGAQIAYDAREVYKESHILLKVAPPTLEEAEWLHPNQILISAIQIALINEGYIHKLREKRVIAIAMEYLRDRNKSFPVVRIMSEIAGISAMHTAAELLSYGRGPGILLGGITGVPPAKVVILGAGVVAEYATRTALGLGADVRIFDNNVYKLMRLQSMVGRLLPTSTINPIALEKELLDADVAIGAIHSKSGRAPLVVTEEQVAKMKPGSVIVDVSIDQGGCFETSQVTTHERPTFSYHGVTHYCVPNIASRVPRTASDAITNILTPMLLEILRFDGIEHWLSSHPGVVHGLYTYKGSLTNRYLAERFGIKYTDVALLIPSNM
jgi:alanine dehydrogenase